MTEEDRARHSAGLAMDLRTRLIGSNVPVECIGVRTVVPMGFTELIVYVANRLNCHAIPTEFDGLPVRFCVVGRIREAK